MAVNNPVNRGANANFPQLQIPKFDLSILNTNSSSPEGNLEFKNLRIALTVCGFFQVVNHGIESSSLDQLYDVTKRFFSIPLEEKQKYSRPQDADLDGFGNDQILDGNDRLYLDLCPEDQRVLKLWPENPKDFRKILLGCGEKLQKLNDLILKAMAKSLNLEENAFLKLYGESPRVLLRFNYSPPCSRPQALPLGVGAKPHSDASALTFFLQDKQVEGLQVLRGDQWFGTPPLIPHAIQVMPGDQAEIMTNGIFKSPMHRFVKKSEEEGITISIFFTPDKRNVIEPVEGFVDDKRPRLYKPVVDYAGAFYHDNHEGSRVIDALKI